MLWVIPDKFMVKFSDQLFRPEVEVNREEEEREWKNCWLTESRPIVYLCDASVNFFKLLGFT